jgi:asparagine synthase (glutamine-hydrolysing)
MCGIAGFLGFSGPAQERLEALRAMSDTMVKRGPDGEGLWTGEDGRVGLAHRRLSIIAPGPDGAQPMLDAPRRLVIAFNGEIYNYRELRAELVAKGRVFRTEGSDTETILAAFAEWGEAGFARLRGMYAIAIWDAQRKCLVLARDPYGIKPLFVSHRPDRVTFASQLRALIKDRSMDMTIDPAALVGFGIWGSIPEPFTMVRAGEMVPAGRWVRFDMEGTRTEGTIQDVSRMFAAHENDVPGDLVSALRESLAAHLVADVEVGCFLSSGVDSSAIAGMMHDRAEGRVRAITLAFDEYAGTSADELPLAAEVGRRYGFEHMVERVTAADFAAAQAGIVADMDQPSIDGVNTWFVSRGANRAGLKVALSGLGGDEALAGYSTFRTVPQTLRSGSLLSHLPRANRIASWGLKTAGMTGKAVLAPLYAHSLAQAYLLRRAMLLPEQLDTILPPEIVTEGLERLQPIERLEEVLAHGPENITAQIALLEATQYMRNQLLRDSDWAGMAHSLEIRVPLVDIELLAAMAPHQKVFGRNPGAGKRVLAQTPSTPLPRDVVDRPKTGFQVPVSQWRSASGDPVSKGSTGWARSVLDSYLGVNRLTL